MNINKARGWDNASTRMVRICRKSLAKPLLSIYNFSLHTGIFPSQWKKAMLFQFIKKATGALLKTMDQCRYFQCLANYLRSAFMMHFTIILLQIIFFLHVSSVLNDGEDCFEWEGI